MCELFGMSFNEPVSSLFSFRGFTKRGNNNPHGWGMALYPEGGNAAQIFKEPANSNNSSLAEYIISTPEFTSKLYIAHVRYMSCGAPNYGNTHPFSRELNGKEYCFAHNGTLGKSYRQYLDLNRYRVIGETDSEHAFCHLLSFIENNIGNWEDNSFVLLYNKLQNINTFGRFNCIFSDGKHLFCYHDTNGYNGLYHVKRRAPFTDVNLKDEDYNINFQIEKPVDQAGYVIASHPITNEDWVKFSPGELIVFKSGAICYSSKSQISTSELDILKVIKNAPHKICIEEIKNSLDMSYSEASLHIGKLVDKGYIKQDSRDTVVPLDKRATYYCYETTFSAVNQTI